LNLKKETTSRI